MCGGWTACKRQQGAASLASSGIHGMAMASETNEAAPVTALHDASPAVMNTHI